MAQTMTADQPIGTGIGQRRSFRDWPGWHYVSGLAFVVVGILALAEPPLASLAASFYVGAMLCVAGAFMLVGGIANISHHGGRIGAFLGLLSLVAGLVFLKYPIAGVVSLVWITGVWLIVGGIFELAMGFNLPIGRGWLILVSLANIALGLFVVMLKPAAAFSFLGYVVGVSLLLQGSWSLVFTSSLRGARTR